MEARDVLGDGAHLAIGQLRRDAGHHLALDILDNPKGYYGELGVGMTDEEEVLEAELTVAAGNDLNNKYLYGLSGFAPLLVDLHGSYYLYLTDSVYLKPHATVVYRLPALAAVSESPVGWNVGLAAGWGI